jgi:hypothetical protein
MILLPISDLLARNDSTALAQGGGGPEAPVLTEPTTARPRAANLEPLALASRVPG